MVDKASVETDIGAAPPRPLAARERLGALLVHKGLITLEQLEATLSEAPPGSRIGELLVSRQLVDEEDIAKALADQYGQRFLELSSSPPDPEVARLLPEQLARRYNAIPVRQLDNGLLLVAFVDPTDLQVLDELSMALSQRIQPGVSEPAEIVAAIDAAWRNTAESSESADQPMAGIAAIDAAVDNDSPAMDLVNNLLRRVIASGASDLHFVPTEGGLVVRARVDGVMRDFNHVAAELQAAVIARLKVMASLDIAERRLPQDGRVSITLADTRMDLRLAILPTTQGESAILRILRLDNEGIGISLEDLGMSSGTREAFNRALAHSSGSIIVCGPTGSGKTTTLYTALKMLNDGQRAIVTIEDPVETIFYGVNQVEVNARAGLSFARGLRTILRSDPDVILIGEIRDHETAEIAMQSALTGHLVLSTLHAEDVLGTVARVKDMGLSHLVLSSAIRCILAQRLLRRLCERCKEPSPEEANLLPQTVDGRSATPFKAKGCSACMRTGYSGRVGIFEILELTPPLRALIEQPTANLLAEAVSNGMSTLHDDALRLCAAGTTSSDEVRRALGRGLEPLAGVEQGLD
jgi:type IV pilus assembly protein PilB